MANETPEDVIAAFSRSANFPRDKAGLKFLAEGLRRASEQTEVPMGAIAARCAESSPYCPTDFDLFAAAREIKRANARHVPAPLSTEIRCGNCLDTGWQESTVGAYTVSRRCPSGCKVPEGAL